MSSRRSISNTFAITTMDEPIAGPRGKIGRFYYYAQEWTNSSSPLYIVTDAQAPYFLYNNKYWVFNPEENYPNGISMSKMGTPSSNNSKWQLMTNDFKYIITEALFGSFAHLGSFIINGHWMISQHGTINGQESVNYTQFYPDHPNDNTGTNFIPNFCVDGLTGETYQQNAHIKGTIQAQIFYHNITKPDFHSQSRAATLSDDCGDVVISRVPWTQQNSWVELTLPHAAAQEGRILTVYSGTLFQVTSGYAYTKIFAQEAAGIFRYDDGYSVTSAINVDVGDSAEFYSDGTQWYLLCIRKHAT